MSPQTSIWLPEVMPGDADPTIAEVYERIRATLRVPFVNFVFRVLAALGPGSLARLWDAVEPMAEDRAFEAAAGALRTAARPGEATPPLDSEALVAEEDARRIRAFTDTIHYVLPKLLLVTTAAQEGTPEDVVPRSGERRPGPRDVDPRAAALPMVDPEAAEGDLRDLFAAIRRCHGHPAVASYYRALGAWPGVLRAFWAQVEPAVTGEAHAARREALVAEAARRWRELAPLAGLLRPPLRGSDWDETLGLFRHRMVPDLLLAVSRIQAGLREGEDAARNPLSLPADPVPSPGADRGP